MNEKKKTEKLESFAKAMEVSEWGEIMPLKLEKSLDSAEAFNKKLAAAEGAFEKPWKAYAELGTWNEAQASYEESRRESSRILRESATLAKTPFVDCFAKQNEDAATRRAREQDYLKALIVFRQQCKMLNAERDRILEVPATGRVGSLLSADKLKVAGRSASSKMHNQACMNLVMEAYALLKQGLRMSNDRGKIFRGEPSDYNQRAMNRAMNANEVTAGKIWQKYLKLESQKMRLTPRPMVSRPGKGGAR
jgi:hypothetical protein